MRPKITIIIKALNEENNIAQAISSALRATKDVSAEIILADSLSTDKTVSIAKQYPIRIVRLRHACHRSCGVGPQLGFQHAHGDFIYILDGDMELEKGFLEVALDEFAKDPLLAGIAGSIEEMHAVNLIFKRRQQQRPFQTTYLDRLEMGGLYRRTAIEDVGWFSNRNLHAYEEAELGFRLSKKGWKLKRVVQPAIRHYGYDLTSFASFRRRFKTGYVKGSGELLRSALGTSYFWHAFNHVKLYVAVIVWWLMVPIAVFVLPVFLTQLFFVLTLLFLLIFFFKKRSLTQFFFSLVSWHVSAIGMIWGFFSRQVSPYKNIPSEVIK